MANEAGAQLNLILEPSKEVMHLTVRRGEKLLAGIVLDAAQLDATIAGLVQMRSQMLPALPGQLADGTPVREISATGFDFGTDADRRELVFSFQDRTFGWLSFRFKSRLLERMLKVARSVE